MSIKYYRYDEEIDIVPRDVVKDQIRWCQSPLFQPVPGCMKAFYTCEFEKHFGPVKHDPEFKEHMRIKKGTDVTCKDMPLEYCQKLVDRYNMVCPSCGQDIKVKEHYYVTRTFPHNE